MNKTILILFSVLHSLQINSQEISYDFKESYKTKLKSAEHFLTQKYPEFLTPSDSPELVEKNDTHVFKWQYPQEMVGDPILGYKHRPSSEVRHIQRSEDKLIYDAIYSFDQYSRRITPVALKKSYTKFITLFGCSFTYGNALNDNQTINYFIATKNMEYYPFNYGIGASGTNTMLALTENRDFENEIPLKTGAFVYVFIDDHIARATGKWPQISWMGNTPYYEFKDAGPVKVGTLESSSPSSSSFIKLIGSAFGKNILKNRTFPAIGNDDLDYICKLATATRDNLAKRFPSSPFIFYSHPFVNFSHDRLKNCLVSNKVIFHQGNYESNPKFSNKTQYNVELDGHPNQFANELIAEEILTLVKKYSK